MIESVLYPVDKLYYYAVSYGQSRDAANNKAAVYLHDPKAKYDKFIASTPKFKIARAIAGSMNSTSKVV